MLTQPMFRIKRRLAEFFRSRQIDERKRCWTRFGKRWRRQERGTAAWANRTLARDTGQLRRSRTQLSKALALFEPDAEARCRLDKRVRTFMILRTNGFWLKFSTCRRRQITARRAIEILEVLADKNLASF